MEHERLTKLSLYRTSTASGETFQQAFDALERARKSELGGKGIIYKQEKTGPYVEWAGGKETRGNGKHYALTLMEIE